MGLLPNNLFQILITEESTQEIFNSLRGAGSQEVFQGGLCITQCFQRAVQNLTPEE